MYCLSSEWKHYLIPDPLVQTGRKMAERASNWKNVQFLVFGKYKAVPNKMHRALLALLQIGSRLIKGSSRQWLNGLLQM